MAASMNMINDLGVAEQESPGFHVMFNSSVHTGKYKDKASLRALLSLGFRAIFKTICFW
jgi:hypothetical protein